MRVGNACRHCGPTKRAFIPSNDHMRSRPSPSASMSDARRGHPIRVACREARRPCGSTDSIGPADGYHSCQPNVSHPEMPSSHPCLMDGLRGILGERRGGGDRVEGGNTYIDGRLLKRGRHCWEISEEGIGSGNQDSSAAHFENICSTWHSRRQAHAVTRPRFPPRITTIRTSQRWADECQLHRSAEVQE